MTITIPGRKLGEKYRLHELLGQGTYSSVWRGTAIDTNQDVAVKIINKNECKKQNSAPVEKEILLHRSLNHPNIVKLLEVLEDGENVYLIEAYCAGGELFQKIGFHPSVSHFYFVQLLSAVSYLHSRGICHRDIKPENLLLDERGNLKLADFGLSTLFKKGNTRRTLQTRCGTSLYMAPEVIDGAYEGDQADLWSCAVVLFVMLTGSHPWEEPSMKCSLYRRFSLMSHHDYPPWDQFEPECSNLLDRMLKADRRQRLSMEQIKRHRWTLERNPLLDQNGQCLDPKALAHLLRLDIPIDSPFPLTQPAAPSIRHSQVTASKYSSFLAFSQPSADIIKLNDDELGENSFCSTLTRFYCQIDPFAASSKLICILDTFLISWKNQPSPHHVQNLLLV